MFYQGMQLEFFLVKDELIAKRISAKKKFSVNASRQTDLANCILIILKIHSN